MTRQRAPKKLREAVSELVAWLPNYHGEEYPKIIFRILASMPGGDEMEDVGYEPIGGMGWKELDMLGQLIDAIETKDDVEYAVRSFLSDDEDNE